MSRTSPGGAGTGRFGLKTTGGGVGCAAASVGTDEPTRTSRPRAATRRRTGGSAVGIGEPRQTWRVISACLPQGTPAGSDCNSILSAACGGVLANPGRQAGGVGANTPGLTAGVRQDKSLERQAG